MLRSWDAGLPLTDRQNQQVSGHRHAPVVESVRFGLAVRALRRRRGWTQDDLGRRADCSRSAIARIERGEASRSTVEFLERVLRPLDARLLMRVLWHGEELDRLIDADHAALVGEVARRLTAMGWSTHLEVTFQVFGERGSIDVLAIHPGRGAVLVIEVKSVVPDLQSTLAGLDRKVRLAPQILRERGLVGGAGVSRLLVLPGNSTTYRRFARLPALDSALPSGSVDVRRWLESPGESDRIDGRWFIPNVTGASARHRVRRRVAEKQA